MAAPESPLTVQAKSLPHSEESERAVLGALLLDPERLKGTRARLRTEQFYFERHQLVYAAMLALADEGHAADLVTLGARLDQAGKLEAAGGLAYLAGLDVDLPDVGRLDSYAEIVVERALRRSLITRAVELVRDAQGSGRPGGELLAELAAWSRSQYAGRATVSSMADVMDGTLAAVEEASADRSGSTLLRFGLKAVDRWIPAGLRPGQLIILAGRPGSGKSAAALGVAQHNAQAGRGVVYFSDEMSREELGMRLLAAETGIPSQSLLTGHLSARQCQAMVTAARALAELPLHIDDSGATTPERIREVGHSLASRQPLGLVVVDYLQLMRPAEARRLPNRNAELEALTRGLKQLAKELAVPVLALSQLTRDNERRGGGDHRPKLSDLRGSGSIEQDADMVVFLHHEHEYDATAAVDRAEVILAKHRNGQTGTAHVAWNAGTTQFRDLDLGPAPF
ncbi:MAG TPA: replicative DNA helicase [Thermoanaerobaculia bacterium]|nr:replicative DNA helicase [Thermoanaerobaculia bacterium]